MKRLYTEANMVKAIADTKQYCKNYAIPEWYDGKIIGCDFNSIINAPSPPLPEGIEIPEMGANIKYLDPKINAMQNAGYIHTNRGSKQDEKEQTIFSNGYDAAYNYLLSKLTNK